MRRLKTLLSVAFSLVLSANLQAETDTVEERIRACFMGELPGAHLMVCERWAEDLRAKRELLGERCDDIDALSHLSRTECIQGVDESKCHASVGKNWLKQNELIIFVREKIPYLFALVANNKSGDRN